jgi:hypothetical protein
LAFQSGFLSFCGRFAVVIHGPPRTRGGFSVLRSDQDSSAVNAVPYSGPAVPGKDPGGDWLTLAPGIIYYYYYY